MLRCRTGDVPDPGETGLLDHSPRFGRRVAARRRDASRRQGAAGRCPFDGVHQRRGAEMSAERVAGAGTCSVPDGERCVDSTRNWPDCRRPSVHRWCSATSRDSPRSKQLPSSVGRWAPSRAAWRGARLKDQLTKAADDADGPSTGCNAPDSGRLRRCRRHGPRRRSACRSSLPREAECESPVASPAASAALAGEVLRAMLFTKLKIAPAIAFFSALLISGAATWARQQNKPAAPAWGNRVGQPRGAEGR